MNNIEKMVAVYAAETQEVENALFEVLVDSLITTGIGVQLDGIGVIVGETRQGLTDLKYRRVLQAAIIRNRSAGTPEEMYDVVQAALGPAVRLEFGPESNAGFELEALDVLGEGDGARAASLLRRGRMAGVNGYLIFFQSEPIFAFDGGPAGGAKFDGGYKFKTAL